MQLMFTSSNGRVGIVSHENKRILPRVCMNNKKIEFKSSQQSLSDTLDNIQECIPRLRQYVNYCLAMSRTSAVHKMITLRELNSGLIELHMLVLRAKNNVSMNSISIEDYCNLHPETDECRIYFAARMPIRPCPPAALEPVPAQPMHAADGMAAVTTANKRPPLSTPPSLRAPEGWDV